MAKKIGIIVAVGLFGLIISALLVRACLQRRRRSARAGVMAGSGFGGQSYRSLKDSSVNVADTHAMPNLSYGRDEYPASPPAYGGQQFRRY